MIAHNATTLSEYLPSVNTILRPLPKCNCCQHLPNRHANALRRAPIDPMGLALLAAFAVNHLGRIDSIKLVQLRRVGVDIMRRNFAE
jgi:hypothetical protein